ncbi:MAG TPA: hypothetical protein H9902_14500, partial [Candidatus Stackebrandtia faecavium]|nr:hypothetical protein [Candidatus Stackebrandtia faecavium]
KKLVKESKRFKPHRRANTTRLKRGPHTDHHKNTLLSSQKTHPHQSNQPSRPFFSGEVQPL